MSFTLPPSFVISISLVCYRQQSFCQGFVPFFWNARAWHQAQRGQDRKWRPAACFNLSASLRLLLIVNITLPLSGWGYIRSNVFWFSNGVSRVSKSPCVSGFWDTVWLVRTPRQTHKHYKDFCMRKWSWWLMLASWFSVGLGLGFSSYVGHVSWFSSNTFLSSFFTDNLLIDYQFTFSLIQEDDNHYTAINFMASPEQVIFYHRRPLSDTLRRSVTSLFPWWSASQ